MSMAYPILASGVPAMLLWFLDRRRFGAGLCARCGYDRRGLAESAKCPECGTVPTT